MAIQIKKYKFLKDFAGIQYGQDGNDNVLYKIGNIAYGINSDGSDLVYIYSTKTENFDATKEKSVAVPLTYLQETTETINITNDNIISDQQYNEIQNTMGTENETADTATAQKSSFWNKKYDLPLFKLFAGSVILFAIGYYIGRITCKQK